MDILNVQSLIAQGLITDVASVDPNKAYVAVGVFQPGNRQAGAAGNAYPSYAMPISEFLTGGGGVIGSGTVNYIPKWTPNGTTLGNSIMYEDAGKIGIGTITPAEKLNVVGTVRTDFTALGYTPAYTIFNNGAAAAEFGYNTTYGAIINANSGILALNPVSGNVGIGTTFSNAKLSFGGFYNTTGTPTSNEQTSHIKLYEGGGSYYGFGMSYDTKAVLTIAANSNVGNIGFYTNSLQRALIDENGNFGIGTASPTAKVYILQNTVGTGAKGLSVNFATIGETFYIDDNGYAKYYGGGFTVAGSNGILNIVSNGGVSPSINFQYNNGASVSGSLYGVGSSMFFETPALGIGSVYSNPQAKVHISGLTNSGEKLFRITTTSGLWDILDVGQGTITSAVNNWVFKASGAPGTGANPVITLYDETGGNPSLYMYSALYTSNTLAIDGLGIPRFTAVYSNRLWFNSNVGVGLIATLDTRLWVQGSDATSSNYALKVDNSASSPLLYVRNDGNIGIGTILPTAKLDVRGQIIAGPTGNITSNDSPFYSVRTNLGSPNYYTGMQYAFEVGGGIWGIGFNYANDQYQFLGGSTAKFIFGSGNPTTPNGKFIMDMSSGYFGANIVLPTATIHGKALDSTSGNYTLKLDNLTSPLLYVRNDGQVEMNGFTIRQLSSSTIFKTSGTGGYMFNNASDSTNLGKITNTGQILFGDISDANYVGAGMAVKALGLTSNVTKEIFATFFKSNTDQDGLYFSSKQGAVYMQPYSVNAVNQSLILGGRNAGTGVLETLTLKSSGVVNIANMPTSSAGLVAGDLWNNSGVVTIV